MPPSDLVQALYQGLGGPVEADLPRCARVPLMMQIDPASRPDWLGPPTGPRLERRPSPFLRTESGREDGHGHLSADGSLCAACQIVYNVDRPRTHEEAVRLNPTFNGEHNV